MSKLSRRPIAGPTRTAWLPLLLILAACWTLAAPSASAVEPDRRMAEFERRLTELEGRLLASEGESAQSKDPTEVIAALERRVSLLERKLRARGDTVQIRGPLEVTDAGGDVVLRVGGDPEYKGAAVSISRLGDRGGYISLFTDGQSILELGSNSKRDGRMVVTRSDGTAGVFIDGAGLFRAFAPSQTEVVVLGVSAETGRLALFNGTTEIAVLGQSGNAGTLVLAESDKSPTVQLGPGGNGNTALRIYNPAGTPVAVLGVDPGRDDTGTLLVSNSKGGVSAAVMRGDRGAVVVADGSGSTVAQMSVSDEARGIFQVFNAGVSVAALTKGATGGMLQLASDGGVPMVEAGVMANGRGTVRAGPNYKCVPAQGMLNVVMPDCLVGRD